MIRSTIERARHLWSDEGGQAQVPDLVKFAAIALPIIVGLVAVYQYYGKGASDLMKSAEPKADAIQTP